MKTPHDRHPARMIRILTAGLAATALAALAACSSSSTSSGQGPVPKPKLVSAAKLSKVTLKVGDQKAGAEARLMAAGLLKNVPYKIQWSTFTSGPPELEAVSAGAIDVGGVGNTPPIFSAAAHAKIVIVSASQDNAAGDTILVPKGSPIHSVAQLKGKTVGVAKGSSAHGNLLLQLKKAGMTPEDIKTSFLAPSDAYAAFTEKRIDAWAVWDPYSAQAQVSAGARILVNGTGVANGLGFNVASRDALADPARNTAIRDYVMRIAKAYQWTHSHPTQWAKVYAAQTGLPLKATLLSSERSEDKPVALTSSILKSEQSLADAFYNAKVIPAKPTFSDYVDHRFDSEIAALS